MALKEGDRAPDFELKSDSGERVRLSEELKQHEYVVVAFFPAAFSPVCTNELNIFQEALEELENLKAGVLGLSTDNWYSLQRVQRAQRPDFPAAFRFPSPGFGGLPTRGPGRRRDGRIVALFIMDRDRKVVFAEVVERGVNPGVDKVLEKLEELTGEEPQWKAAATG